MKVLITGGAGFIGSHIAEYYHTSANVVVLDNLRTGCPNNLTGLNVEFINASILDRDAVSTAMRGVDYVFHMAAMVSVPESVEQPDLCHEINVEGLNTVLSIAAESGAKKLCFASSAAVYGDEPTIPKRESMKPQPMTPYATSKLDGENHCEEFANNGLIDTACLRFFNVFGPRQNPNSAYAAAVPIFMHRAMNSQPITLHGDGEQTRDFVYVKDVVRAMAFAATQNKVQGVYNLGYGKRTSIKSLAKSIIQLADSTSHMVHEDERVGDIKHSLASPEKLFSAGFTPAFTLESGLKETLESL